MAAAEVAGRWLDGELPGTVPALAALAALAALLGTRRRLNIERRPRRSVSPTGRLLRRGGVHFQFISIRLVGLSRLRGGGRTDAGNPVLIRRRRQSRPRRPSRAPRLGPGSAAAAVVAPPGPRPHSGAVIGEPLSSHDSRSVGRSTRVCVGVSPCRSILGTQLCRVRLSSATARC